MSLATTPRRIRKLSTTLANQIAAGEVIERPSSVIKELLENSLDAGATRIDIDVERGGIQLIRVRDNGQGIHPEDISLALESQATSKVYHADELERIASLGFRGEALPSIASVAAVILTSRTPEADSAWSIRRGPAGDNPSAQPAPHPPGTTVEVRELFHTIPGRKKFLRSERTEFLHILEMIRRIALSRFNVSLTLRHNGKRVLACRDPGEHYQERVAAIMGQAFINHSQGVQYRTSGMHLWGWLVDPAQSRSQTDHQYCYLNGRMLRDKRITHAIRLAYGDSIPPGRYPEYLLYLEMDPGGVDVNVHPSKYEVRFRALRDVHDFIHAGVSSVLAPDRRPYASGEDVGDRHMDLSPPGLGTMTSGWDRTHLSVREPVAASTGANPPELGSMVALLEQRYILTRRGASFLLLDAEAIRRHIARSRFNQAREDEPVQHRPLLVPVNLRLSETEVTAIEAHTDLLGLLGFSLQRSSPDSLVLRSLPVFLPDADIRAILDELARLLLKQKTSRGVRAELIEGVLRHTGHGVIEQGTVAELAMQLQATGLDITTEEYPPLWRTLNSERLQELLGRDD